MRSVCLLHGFKFAVCLLEAGALSPWILEISQSFSLPFISPAWCGSGFLLLLIYSYLIGSLFHSQQLISSV